ncbi:helix-turn-helix domain-containing protein [Kibdelosporangium phytohabitans]|uniref:Helix-turn-helix domain-containing protein n=1 Tax=Kibdelosporangium phytohabitans TaxID=860235 RepID=A0A0N9HY41_9PSEU|nr:helix-turn-helix domain-containing protein [Kibdelosporangium phytohabitans]ALG06813.1 hypothetical protein AOZ06_07625 [Kibdelosporangium phytohabitans]MBE1468055.1 hypothetical protein [Kibdelosporangium phytohabitans]
MTAPAALADDQAFYTPKEVAQFCRVDYMSVINACKAGTIPCQKFGRIRKIPGWWVREQIGLPKPVLSVVPDPAPVVADYAPIAAVLEIFGRAALDAAGVLRGAS